MFQFIFISLMVTKISYYIYENIEVLLSNIIIFKILSEKGKS